MSNPDSTVPRSCLDCPSYLKAAEVPSMFKKSVGAPMCGRYGHVLGKRGATEGQVKKIAQHHAKHCDSYGFARPVQPESMLMQVTMPDMEARVEHNDLTVKSCAMCQNYVREDIVAGELGWTGGLCAAKGKLLLSTRLSVEARDCSYRSFGPARQSTAGMALLPEFEDAFTVAGDPIQAYFKNAAHGIVEPHEYPTDREVTPEQEANGIRAWRKMLDPEGTGKEIYLPVYRIDFFSPEEQAKIPRTGDDEHPELYIDHFGGGYLAGVTWTELDETPALWGEAGTGKTELGRYLAWLMCLPFERISITGQTELDDLAGKMLYTKERGTYFQYGRIPLAWSKPCVLTIDEPNVGPPEVWQFLRPLFDNSKQMVLDVNEGERIKRHLDCYPMLAMNPAWDVKNVGTAQIGDADASRLFHVFVELPSEKLEREIIRKRVALDGWDITEKQLNMVMKIAADLRAACADDTLPITWGIRPQIKVARALRWFTTTVAYRRAVGDFLEPEAQQVMLDIVRSHATD